MADTPLPQRTGIGTDANAGARFDRLVEIMRALRAPGGCPWDREQTLGSLRPFVLEETYEVLEAIESGNAESLREELGDYLYEAVFLAQISEEAGDFSIADAIGAVCDKLVRRHPHVFARAADDPTVTTEQVVERWEVMKAREREALSPGSAQVAARESRPESRPAGAHHRGAGGVRAGGGAGAGQRPGLGSARLPPAAGRGGPPGDRAASEPGRRR